MHKRTRSSPYGKAFYDHQQAGSLSSARIVIPELLSLIKVRSAVDVGCGVGTWLKVLEEQGISDVLGIDGDYVDRRQLQLPDSRFCAKDIREPFHLDRRFDLALSLEVAEHLPMRCAETFVDSLVRLAPVILFSAAIPFQGGTNHLNEQWPEYWAAMFKGHGYTAVDCIRRRVWSDPSVEWWYAQNMVIYASEEGLCKSPELSRNRERESVTSLGMVHPRLYLRLADPSIRGFRNSIRLTLESGKNAVLKRFKKGSRHPRPSSEKVGLQSM
jgi:SAM-dependent methyltransferase